MTNISRRNFLRNSTTGFASIALTSKPISLWAQPSRGINGQSAPELNVPYWIDSRGKETDAFAIASNQGKWIILKCFQNWCPGCHSAGFPALQKITAAFKDNQQVAIAAIQTTFEGFSTNTQDALLKNQQRYQLAIPFGHDAGDELAPHGNIKRRPTTMVSYRTGGTPWFIVIDPSGKVVYNHFHINADKLIEILQKETIG